MRLQLNDRTELFYTVDDFTDPWEEPETVVMHHGMAKNHQLWYGWVPTVARHFRVIRFDMRGMGRSDVPPAGYPWTLNNFTNDLEEFVDKMGLERFHLIGETVGGSISMNYSTRHQDRLLSLAVCTSPTNFDSHHQESAEPIAREGISAWVDDSIGRRLDPDIVPQAYIRWYADQMKATPAEVVHGFQSNAGGDLGPLLKDVQTPVLVLAAANLREEVLGDFRGAADLFPNGKRVVFPGVTGFVQHILPTPCARVWLDWVRTL